MHNEQLMDDYVRLAKATNDVIGLLNTSIIVDMHDSDELSKMSVSELRDFACMQAGKLKTFIGSGPARWETHEEFEKRIESIDRSIGDGNA